MAFEWYIPRKKHYSAEPRVSISDNFISVNPGCVDKYIKDKKYIKIGYDIAGKKMILVPTEKGQKSLKMVENKKWEQRYLNAKSFIKSISSEVNLKGHYMCSWSEEHKGILIDLVKDKIQK